MLTSDNFVLNKYTTLQMRQHLDTKFNKLNSNHIKDEMIEFELALKLDAPLGLYFVKKIDVSLSSPTLMNQSPNQSASALSSATYKTSHQCNQQLTTTTNSSKLKDQNLGIIRENSSSKKI